MVGVEKKLIIRSWYVYCNAPPWQKEAVNVSLWHVLKVVQLKHYVLQNNSKNHILAKCFQQKHTVRFTIKMIIHAVIKTIKHDQAGVV